MGNLKLDIQILNIWVHCAGQCPSCTSEGNDRLSETNDTKFEVIAKEEEDRDFCVYLM
jgi:hypothetical protein